MRVDEYIEQHKHKAGLAYYQPVIEAWPVKEGDEIVEFAGRNVTDSAPGDGWQVFSRGIGQFYTPEEFAMFYEAEQSAAALKVTHEKGGLKLMTRQAFADNNAGNNAGSDDQVYRAKLAPDAMPHAFIHVREDTELIFDGMKVAVPAGSILYEDMHSFTGAGLATAEEFSRDFKVSQPAKNARPGLKVIRP